MIGSDSVRPPAVSELSYLSGPGTRLPVSPRFLYLSTLPLSRTCAVPFLHLCFTGRSQILFSHPFPPFLSGSLVPWYTASIVLFFKCLVVQLLVSLKWLYNCVSKCVGSFRPSSFSNLVRSVLHLGSKVSLYTQTFLTVYNKCQINFNYIVFCCICIVSV